MIKNLLFSLVILLSSLSYSQTVTLGTGTLINSITTASPVNINWRRQVSQTVYTAAELNAAGVTGPSAINQMGYFVTNIPIYNIPGYTIQMKHTTATNAGGNLNGGYTTVKNAFTYAPTQGNWDMLTLDTPFLWDGVSNIVVRICWSQVQPTFNPSGQLRVYAATNGYKYRRDDFGGSICGSTPSTTWDYKPQIRFVFASETIWTGAVSTDWNTNTNWTANVPDETMDALIPNGVPNFPTLTGVGSCKNLNIQSQMTLAVGARLSVYSNFNNIGSFLDLGGFTTMTGDGANIINNSGTVNFSTLICESKNGTTITGANVTIIKELQVNKSVLNTNNLITLKSDANGTARINELPTECFYTLNMYDSWGDGWNGGVLYVIQDGDVIGAYQAYQASTTVTLSLASGSNIDLFYQAGNFENENTYNLVDPNGNTIFSDGPTPATGYVFNTTPSCGFTPPIQGQISMERYIDAGETYWRFFSSAVQGATIGDYQDDFVTAGYPGSWFPNFGWVSIYTYDETLPAGQGYLPVTSANQVLEVGQGIDVWSGDTITGTQPFVVDLQGVANQGDIVMPVTYTNTGAINEDGWNLVGNPYASTIDWDSPNWVKTNIANAIQILNPDSQQYATYVNGASTNGGSRYIASQQAFWVYASAANPILTATEKVKSATDAPFFKSGTISPGMHIKIEGNSMSDECVVRHVPNAVDAYETEFDAYKNYGGWGTNPTISLINSSNQDLTVHSFDIGFQTWQIPVKVNVFQTGFYNLTFTDIVELDVPCLKLEDIYTGVMYNINEAQPINIELSDTTFLPRFILHIGKNYNLNANDVTCNGYNDGEVLLDLNINTTVDYVLTSSNNSVTGQSAGNPLLIDGLTAGTYLLEVPGLQNLCNTTNFNFVVNSPSSINGTSIIENEMLGNDGSVIVQLNGGTPPYTYNWSNGNITDTLMGLSEGDYTLNVTDANGCEFSDTYSIQSFLNVNKTIDSDLTVKFYNVINAIKIGGLNNVNVTEVNIYAINGQLVDTFIVPEKSSEYVHLLKKELKKGVYFVKVGNITLKFVN